MFKLVFGFRLLVIDVIIVLIDKTIVDEKYEGTRYYKHYVFNVKNFIIFVELVLYSKLM